MNTNLKAIIAALFSVFAIAYMAVLTVEVFAFEKTKVDGLALYLPVIATLAQDRATTTTPKAELLSYLTK